MRQVGGQLDALLTHGIDERASVSRLNRSPRQTTRRLRLAPGDLDQDRARDRATEECQPDLAPCRQTGLGACAWSRRRPIDVPTVPIHLGEDSLDDRFRGRVHVVIRALHVDAACRVRASVRDCDDLPGRAAAREMDWFVHYYVGQPSKHLCCWLRRQENVARLSGVDVSAHGLRDLRIDPPATHDVVRVRIEARLHSTDEFADEGDRMGIGA